MKDNPLPDVVVTPTWLQERLDDPALRVFDCTTHLLPAETPADGPYRVRSGHSEYWQGHIPGAEFIDLQEELSDNASALKFTCPSAEQFSQTLSRHGVGPETYVVLYSTNHIMWASRVWWLLRVFGFDHAAVLDGGWARWQAEGRPVSTEPARYPPAEFQAHPRPELIVDRQRVLAGLNDPEIQYLNALSVAYHQGLEPSRYGRPGRIPGSVNVPAASLLHTDTQQLLPLAEAEAQFKAAGVTPDQTVMAYCGGGISATVDLLQLHRLGYTKLTLYDGSLGEWAPDETLPLERG